MSKKMIICFGLAGALLLGNVVFAFATVDNSNNEPIGAAPALSATPVQSTVQDKVEVVPAKEIEADDGLVTYDVKVPKVQGLEENSFQEKFNDAILKKALNDIGEVEIQAKELAALAEKEGWDYREHGIYIDYEVKKSNDGILSFLVNTYMYTGGAHGITRVDTYNIDTEKNTELELKDLFKEGADYQEAINKEIFEQIDEQEKSEDLLYFTGEDGFRSIKEEQDFYLQDENLVIVFQKYDIAPGAMGTPEFMIPLAELNAILKDRQQTIYFAITGIVKEVIAGEQTTTFWIEDKDGNPADLTISKETYIVNNAKITPGTNIIAFYDSSLLMIMIYPPRYSVEVLAVVNEEENIKVDRFDENLVSSDKALKLNISDKTKIISQYEAPFKDELTNKKLVVVYGPSTKSIPAQTNPYQVVVLHEKAVPPIHELYDLMDFSKMEIVVNNTIIKAPKAYFNKQSNVVMVPIRAICEALGYEVHWHDATKSVTVGNEIALAAGRDSYSKTKDVEVKLGAAPEITEDRLFVPLNFFKEVVTVNNAYVFEAQIVIDDGELME